MRHIVCIDAYEGELEPLSNDPGEREVACGLGLPWEELAAAIGARVTLLHWADWYAYEALPGAFSSWTEFPATRRVSPQLTRPAQRRESGEIASRAIPAVDPGHGGALTASAMSGRAYGLLAEGDPLFLVSVALRDALERLHTEQPIDLIVVPAWGGLGYVAQLDAATGAGPLEGCPFAAVVTGLSRERLRANEEGEWTRMAIARRQREELSVALAEVALVFGDRGERVARSLRLRDAAHPVLAPRTARSQAALTLRNTRPQPAPSRGVEFVLHGLQDGSSGALVALDAARILADSATQTRITASGAEMRFAPMTPRSFRAYWSTRTWVKRLEEAGTWSWEDDAGARSSRQVVRMYPALFAHLADPWGAALRREVPLMSECAAEGVAPGVAIPAPLLLGESPTPPMLAARLLELSALAPEELAALGGAFREALLTSHEGEEWTRRLAHTASALADAAAGAKPPALGRVLRRQIDPRRRLAEVDESSAVEARAGTAATDPTLGVVVTCHEMGDLVRETVESIWQSSRVPDEVVVIDDGSVGKATREALDGLRLAAAPGRRPLRIVHQANRGLAAARNAGLNLIGSEFVSFLDGDDLIAPDFYARALALLAREPMLGGVAAWAELFNAEGEAGWWNAPQPEFPLLLVENQVFVPVLMRTAQLRALGGYDEGQRYNYEDWELSVRYLAHGAPIVTIPRYLQRYRVREDSLYRTMTDVQHQVMRERLLVRHRETADRFGVEMALQLEHQVSRQKYPRPQAAAGVDRRPGVLRRTWGAVLRLAGRPAAAGSRPPAGRRRGSA
jgi:Glycosyl transferase family 2